ncbi:MAG: N-acetylmuramate 1-kinase [Acidobacteriota bacterium]|nr:N-acetylmuramate 1-kinase [Acidobacteriota bacterium]
MKREASTRSFFRLHLDKYTLVAMVYPEENKEETERIARLTSLYNEYGLKVPGIKEIIDQRIILQNDLGKVLVQKALSWPRGEERKKILEKISRITIQLARIPLEHTAAVLDTARMKWEMDFFVTHFAGNYFHPQTDLEELRHILHAMVEKIGPVNTFAHRDFHTRNMLYYKNEIYLVDFQDSLRAPAFYDAVSFVFDAYMDLKTLRTLFIDSLKSNGLIMDEEQFYLTALQRNIKALGTFGYQVMVKKNLTYKKYINRTVGYVIENPLFDRFVKESNFRMK